MDKYIYDENNGLWYELQGDYYIPCLELPTEKEERHIGMWGQRPLRYIRRHKKVFYTSLLTSGKLQSHLADAEEQVQELFDRLMKQRAVREGITEKLKADNQMEWSAGWTLCVKRLRKLSMPRWSSYEKANVLPLPHSGGTAVYLPCPARLPQQADCTGQKYGQRWWGYD